jgi:hypothetical protein
VAEIVKLYLMYVVLNKTFPRGKPLRDYGVHSVGIPGIIWDYWNYVGLFGIIWDYMGLCGVMWDYMGLCGIISDYLELFVIIWNRDSMEIIRDSIIIMDNYKESICTYRTV